LQHLFFSGSGLLGVAVGVLLSKVIGWAWAWEGRRARWRRDQAIQQARDWVASVQEADGTTWPPSPGAGVDSPQAGKPAV
jgi:hypothetical protein